MRMLARPGLLARRAVASFLEQWPLALADEIEGIHQARVASRRLRELVPILAIGRRDSQMLRLRRDLRVVTRLLGPSRELDVAIQTLADLANRMPSHGRAVAVVLARVADERARARRAMRQAVRTLDIDSLAARTRALASRFDSPLAIRRCARHAAARLGGRARELEAAVLSAGTVFAPGPLHSVRVALKKFRYALEVAERVGRLRLAGSMRRLKGMQDLLGELHDLQVLTARVRDLIALSPGSDRLALEALVNDIDDAIRAMHSRFVTDRVSLVPVLARSARVCETLITLPPPDRTQARRARRPAAGRPLENP